MLKKIWQKLMKKETPQVGEEIRLLSRQERLSELRKTAGRSRRPETPKNGDGK